MGKERGSGSFHPENRKEIDTGESVPNAKDLRPPKRKGVMQKTDVTVE
ncbi:MAG: hypothetical protein JJU07_05780 [Natronohydrobacter sp.]|nr:hypothetical protein [Natronohydrobacter sp.]